MNAVHALAPLVGVVAACAAMAVPRSTLYRRQVVTCAPPRPPPPRALTREERRAVLDIANSDRFVDVSPAEIVATLLDEKVYHCSTRTMYRILAEAGEVRERRNQLRHPEYKKPELLATEPNQVWSWDITKLLRVEKWKYFYLYVVMDVFSRYVVGWLLAEHENAELAKRLIRETAKKHDIREDQLTIHSDRGAPMTSKTMAQLLTDLTITQSHSRPQVSNDNPFSESQFKTMKYRPDFPDRFDDNAAAREHCRKFFDWYNEHHRHSGIAFCTPADVHWGRAAEVLARRQSALDAAYAAHPERFVSGPPRAGEVPAEVWINPPKPQADTDGNSPAEAAVEKKSTLAPNAEAAPAGLRAGYPAAEHGPLAPSPPTLDESRARQLASDNERAAGVIVLDTPALDGSYAIRLAPTLDRDAEPTLLAAPSPVNDGARASEPASTTDEDADLIPLAAPPAVLDEANATEPASPHARDVELPLLAVASPAMHGEYATELAPPIDENAGLIPLAAPPPALDEAHASDLALTIDEEADSIPLADPSPVTDEPSAGELALHTDRGAESIPLAAPSPEGHTPRNPDAAHDEAVEPGVRAPPAHTPEAPSLIASGDVLGEARAAPPASRTNRSARRRPLPSLGVATDGQPAAGLLPKRAVPTSRRTGAAATNERRERRDCGPESHAGGPARDSSPRQLDGPDPPRGSKEVAQ